MGLNHIYKVSFMFRGRPVKITSKEIMHKRKDRYYCEIRGSEVGDGHPVSLEERVNRNFLGTMISGQPLYFRKVAGKKMSDLTEEESKLIRKKLESLSVKF